MSDSQGNVIQLNPESVRPPAAAGGNGGGNGTWRTMVEQRLTTLEKGMGELKVSVSHLASKEDLRQLEVRILNKLMQALMWVSGITLTALGLVIAFFR